MRSITAHTLVAIRDLLAQGDVSPREVVQACIDRIRATDPAIKATLAPLLEESALAAAADLEKAGPDPAKPLWGVPLAVKDCIAVAKHPTTCASRMLRNFIPFYDAQAVTRLREAGAIILAKTNLDEFAMGSTTESSAMQCTLNPWDCARIPGGSSGGSAASVAARQVFGALASDTGGSIRQPAAMCGCFGIKPTYGRVSRYGAISYASSLDQVGTIARTAADAALLLQVIAGYDPREATSAQVPEEDYLAVLDAKQDLRGVRIGLPRELWSEVTPEVEEACRKAVDEAEKMGAALVEISLPHTRHAVAAYYILATAEASANMARFDGIRFGLRENDATDIADLYVRSRSRGLGEEVKRRILLGAFVLSAGYYDAYYRKAAQVRRRILEDFLKAYAHCDLIAAPTAAMTAWPLGELADDPRQAYMRDGLTVGLNLAGLPGMSMPVGLGSSSNMPVGMQILGPAFAEGRILQTAHILSRAMPDMGEPRCVAGL